MRRNGGVCSKFWRRGSGPPRVHQRLALGWNEMRVRAVQQERGREVRFVKSFVIRKRQVMMMMMMERVRARKSTPNLCTLCGIGLMVTERRIGGSTDDDSASVCGPCLGLLRAASSFVHKTRAGMTKGQAAAWFRTRATRPRKKGSLSYLLLNCHFGARWRAHSCSCTVVHLRKSCSRHLHSHAPILQLGRSAAAQGCSNKRNKKKAGLYFSSGFHRLVFFSAFLFWQVEQPRLNGCSVAPEHLQAALMAR